jgi:hypothetical protein
MTQGESIGELQDNLRDIYKELEAENKKVNAELKGINGQQNCERDSQGELKN